MLLDVRLPGDDGFKLLGEIGGRSDSPFIVVMTAEDTMRSAVEAMKRGAADYLGKPFDLARVEKLVKDLAAAEPEGANGHELAEAAGSSATSIRTRSRAATARSRCRRRSSAARRR